MAYYDFNGTITIDETAARRDIAKINQAIPSLEAAKTALRQIEEEGTDTKGQCGTAIVEKTAELIKKIDQLIQNLIKTRETISQTVCHYREVDRKVKAIIEAATLNK